MWIILESSFYYKGFLRLKVSKWGNEGIDKFSVTPKARALVTNIFQTILAQNYKKKTCNWDLNYRDFKVWNTSYDASKNGTKNVFLSSDLM